LEEAREKATLKNGVRKIIKKKNKNKPHPPKGIMAIR